MLQDYFQQTTFQAWPEANIRQLFADMGVINGKNRFGSSGEHTEFSVILGKKYRIRIINTSLEHHFKFSIDQHSMTVMGADFVPIVPYTQTVLEVGIGSQSFSTLLK